MGVKRYLIFAGILLLASCSATSVETGPSVNLAGVITVGLRLNNDGDFVLVGDVSIPFTPPGLVTGNWDVAFETTLNDARRTANYLYVLWELGNGSIKRQAYDIHQPFEITFGNEQWVQRISHTGDGNIVVYVEIRDLGTETFPCDSNAVNTRLHVGMKARVTTTDDHLPLRIRTLPVTESETYITSLEEGIIMRIMAGPVCNEGWVWWNVTTENGYKGWVGEGDGFIWFIEPAE